MTVLDSYEWQVLSTYEGADITFMLTVRFWPILLKNSIQKN
jgi:hypothetical protein